MRGRPPGSPDRHGRALRVRPADLEFVMRAYGAQMRRCREDANVSAEELAAAIGVSHDIVHHWEAGRRTPRLEHFTAVAMALRVPVDHLIPEV